MEETNKRPLPFSIVKWYGYVFATCYILYGGVSIVLGFMDHNYEDFGKALFFLVIGMVLVSFVVGFRELKVWGWYGMIAMNALVIVLVLPAITEATSIVLCLLSAAALVLLLLPVTKACIFDRR